ncbi:thiamine pyrophosphate-dependent enzyme [Micromonospora sp. SH-82]|uniref:thiamine pyrophosphate-dependent enzyme n=1 Tax=Micromonospora sp. SH-82 TaxID=3132938 RepID=UPI003EB7BE4B
MNSTEAIGALRALLGEDVVVVSGVGRATYATLRHWPGRTLPLDALGDVLPVALGVAAALPPAARTLSIEGDGSLLFGMAGLATLATMRERVAPFTAVVVDNGRYESGGDVASRRFPLDWAALAGAFGLGYGTADRTDEVAAALAAATSVGVLRLVVHDDTPMPPPAWSANGREAVYDFRRMLAARWGVRIPPAATKI